MADNQLPRKFVIRQEVLEATGLSFVTIWSWMPAGTFPRSYTLGPRSVRWDADEVAAWMNSRPHSRFKGDDADGEADNDR